MPLQLRQNNRSILITERARILFKRMREEANRRQDKDIRQNLEDLYKAFRELHSNLGKPSLQLRPFEAKQVPRSSKINLTMREIEQDLDLAYREVGNLGNTFVEVFNYSQSLTNELSNSAESVSSRVIDLRLLEGQLDQNVLIAGDDFVDNSKTDTSFPTQNARAELNTIQGIVTLPRSESVNLVDEKTTIKVNHVTPEELRLTPTVNNINRFYEGNFYNYIGSARPEGGQWHLEEELAVDIPNTGQTSNIIEVSNGSADAVRDGDFIAPFVEQALGEPGDGQILRPEDIIVYDRGATEGEKDIIRQAMVDENPSSFWECEYVKTDSTIQRTVDDAALLDASSQDDVQAAVSASVTFDDIRNQAALASQGNDDDFEVDITFTFDSPKTINWISINPNNFEESAWIDVTDISYALEGDSYQTIPGFADNIYDNTLTDEANSELTNDVQGAILAPSKFSYKGLGVWSFESVEAKSIKLRVRQRTAVPAPYQRLAVRLHRVYTQVYTESSADSGM